MKRNSANYFVLILAVSLFLLTLAFLIHRAMNYNEGRFIYATDDNYIFMAMAKNLSGQGHWSADAKDFSSSSSSHLWLLILSSAFFIFGNVELIPFVINLVAGIFLLYLVWRIFTSNDVSPFLSLFILAAIVYCTPLTSVVLTGQEHTVQTILTIMFLYFISVTLSGRSTSGNTSLKLFVLSVLITSVRYEGLFPVAIATVLFSLKKDFRNAGIILLGGILPVVSYGLISVSKGWYFFPNSVILKGQSPDLSSLYGVLKFMGLSSFELMYSNPAILLLFLTSVVIFISGMKLGKKPGEYWMYLLVIYVFTTFLHMQFARTGSYFRYEAYLVATGLFVIGIALSSLFKGRPISDGFRNNPFIYSTVAVSVIAMMIPLFIRAKTSVAITPTAIMNIYHQQYQMGLFLRDFYNGEIVAANDIGAINYLADIECIDLAGLGSLEVADMMKDKSMTTEMIYELARQKKAKIAIVYDHWFNSIGGLPEQWQKIGNWTIQRNVNVAGSTVSFYAVEPSEAVRLRNSLKEFSLRLPKDIKQSGDYLQ